MESESLIPSITYTVSIVILIVKLRQLRNEFILKENKIREIEDKVKELENLVKAEKD